MSNKGTGLQRVGGNLPGHPQGQGRPRNKTEEITDLIDDIALEFGDQISSMAFQALMDGLRTKDLKLRIDAAKAYFNHFHHPSKQMDVNVTENISISPEARDAADHMTAEERAIMEQFQAHLLSLRDAVDAEVVEGVEVEPQQPAPMQQLPPLPGSGEGQA